MRFQFYGYEVERNSASKAQGALSKALVMAIKNILPDFSASLAADLGY